MRKPDIFRFHAFKLVQPGEQQIDELGKNDQQEPVGLYPGSCEKMAKRLVYAEIPRNYSVIDELVFALQKFNRMKREDDCWKTIPDVSKFLRG